MTFITKHGKCATCGYDWDADAPLEIPLESESRSKTIQRNQDLQRLENLAERKYLEGDNDSSVILRMAYHLILKHEKYTDNVIKLTRCSLGHGPVIRACRLLHVYGATFTVIESIVSALSQLDNLDERDLKSNYNAEEATKDCIRAAERVKK